MWTCSAHPMTTLRQQAITTWRELMARFGATRAAIEQPIVAATAPQPTLEQARDAYITTVRNLSEGERVTELRALLAIFDLRLKGPKRER